MDTNIVIVLVVSVIAIIAAVLITAKVTTNRLKKNAEGTIGNAEEKAREIIDEALKTAENKKRESLLEVKEESIRTKNELDKEIKERRAEAQRYERRVQQKEENIDKKADAIEKREASLASREESLNRMKEEVSRLNEQRVQELERISGLTSEQAKDYLLKIVEDEVKHESAVMIKEMESRAKEEADKKAKEYVVNAIQRCAADHVSETTISVVQLPNDEMKGRIIGREGRNIRTLETMTGVDLIIDDTPEAVILSGFDPIRREVARIALEKLIVDGRIHPARIEEMVEKAQKEVEVMIKEEGEAATLEVGVHGIHPELVRLLGKMKFRTSYGQNALKHSIEVAQLSGLLAAELGLDVRLAKRAGLLHDIGKVAIPVTILDFPGRLSPQDMAVMQSHVTYSMKILHGVVDEEIEHIAVRHHEKLNGKGYPLGLKEEALTTSERIVAIADIISALIGKRSYKEAYDLEKIKEILQEMAEGQYLDDRIVQIACDNLPHILQTVKRDCTPVIAMYQEIRRDYEHRIAQLDR